jgi:succinoglycan biosynthesis protein ExoO
MRMVPFGDFSAEGQRHVGFDVSGGLIPISLTQWIERNRVFSRQPLLGYHKPMFRAEFIQRHGLRYNAALKISDDYFFSAEALAMGARFVMHPRAMYRYAVRAGSLSRSKDSAGTYGQLLGEYDGFMARHGARLDERARRALARSRESLRDAQAWESFAEAIRRHQAPRAAACLLRRPSAARLFGLPLRVRVDRLRRSLGLATPLRMG